MGKCLLHFPPSNFHVFYEIEISGHSRENMKYICITTKFNYFKTSQNKNHNMCNQTLKSWIRYHNNQVGNIYIIVQQNPVTNRVIVYARLAVLKHSFIFNYLFLYLCLNRIFK